MKFSFHYHKQGWHKTIGWRRYQVLRFFVPLGNGLYTEQKAYGIGLVFFTHELSIRWFFVKGENK